jgi:hypothetical protein
MCRNTCIRRGLRTLYTRGGRYRRGRFDHGRGLSAGVRGPDPHTQQSRPASSPDGSGYVGLTGQAVRRLPTSCWGRRSPLWTGLAT